MSDDFTVIPSDMVEDLRHIVELYAEGRDEALVFEDEVEEYKQHLRRVNEILARLGSVMHLDVDDEEEEDVTVINPKRPSDTATLGAILKEHLEQNPD